MMRRYLLPVLAVAGVLIAIGAIILENQPEAAQPPVFEAPKPSFSSYVAGTGVVEASTGDIAIGTPVPGIVTAIYVDQGARVRTGDRLFQIDDRDLKAQLLTARAQVKEAEARLAQAKRLLELADAVPDKRAVSIEDLEKRRFAVASGDAVVAAAKARTEQLMLDIGRRTIRAPVAGQILRIRVRVGEFADNSAASTPLMLLGEESVLYARIAIDEYDIWRVRPGAAAEAFVRGNPALHAPLHFVRIDPYVVPKTSLGGTGTERVDTRVLNFVYSFNPETMPGVYAGQQLDAFIEATASEPPSGKGKR